MSYMARRLAFYGVAAWVAITVNFAIPRLMPGNAVDAMLAKYPQLSASSLHALEAESGRTRTAACPASTSRISAMSCTGTSGSAATSTRRM